MTATPSIELPAWMAEQIRLIPLKLSDSYSNASRSFSSHTIGDTQGQNVGSPAEGIDH
jgi:hypothetical protein